MFRGCTVSANRPAPVGRLRNTAQELGVGTYVRDIRPTKMVTDQAQLRCGLFAGAAARGLRR